MRRCAFVLAAVGLWWCTPQAWTAEDEGDYTVNISVNYGSAYKDKTWAPVDVVIKNDRADVNGWVELKTYAGDMLQSPVYRMPLELPKGSTKRVQFHCYFNGATRLVAQIYHGTRPVLEFPAEFPGLRPVQNDDLICLALDDEGSGFQFLYMVTGSDRRGVGIHRETLSTAMLPFLSEYPQAYDPIDFIVMGKLDPEQVGARQRELMYNYVRNGGVLVVCTGQYAPNYRGTWVEELLGAKIGAEEPVDEAALEAAVFREASGEARAGQQVPVAALTPQAPEVTTVGARRILATKRPLGTGFVYAIAVDADSRALQNSEAYRAFWKEIVAPRRGVGGLNLDMAVNYVTEALPLVSGIIVHSKASVIAYLAVYFAVAVVGNWLFFSWLKRREWAWAALVVFAVGFTAYAMIYGTAGRARTSELHQFQVVRVPQGGGLCAVDSLTGILTAHTESYALSVQHPYPLVEDLYFRDNWMMPQQRMSGFGSSQARPFEVVQGEHPRVENFRIGASELRMMRLRTDAEVAGGIEGALRLDGQVLEGELTNRTGFPLKEAFLEFRGKRYDLRVDGDRLFVHIPAALLQGPAEPMPIPGMMPQFYGGEVQKLPSSALRQTFANYLFASQVDPRDGSSLRPSEEIGPFVCGWSDARHVPSVAPDETLKSGLNETLVVADVALDPNSDFSQLRRMGDLWHWAVEHTDDFDWVKTPEDLRLVMDAGADLVRRNPSDERVSDLVGYFSQFAQAHGDPRTAEQYMDALRFGGKERDEAILWDRMIERWDVSPSERRTAGAATLTDPLTPAILAVAKGEQGTGLWAHTVPEENLGFVRFRPMGMSGVDSFPPGILSDPRQGDPYESLRYMFCYAVTELWSPDERDVHFAHGCDDWSRIFVNGEEVFLNQQGDDASPEQFRFSAHLKQGRNVVLVETGNQGGEWEFSLAPEQNFEGLEVRDPGAPGPDGNAGRVELETGR